MKRKWTDMQAQEPVIVQMREGQIRRRRKYRQMGEQLHRYPNLLNRNSLANRPNEKWVKDISYIPTGQGTLYLSVIRHLFDNSIVAYRMGTEQSIQLVLLPSNRPGLKKRSLQSCNSTVTKGFNSTVLSPSTIGSFHFWAEPGGFGLLRSINQRCDSSSKYRKTVLPRIAQAYLMPSPPALVDAARRISPTRSIMYMVLSSHHSAIGTGERPSG